MSQLARYSSIRPQDFWVTIQSGSALFSKRTTFGDVLHSMANVTGSYSGSLIGSLSLTSAITSSQVPVGSAGALTTYLPIKVNGTNYKLPLYAV